MKCPRCGSEMIPAENLFVCPDCQMVLKQVVPNATEAKGAESVENDEAQKLAEEQKAREEAERIARDEAINAEIKELKSQLSTLKSQVSAKKKEISAKSKQLSNKAQNDQKTKIVSIIRNSVVLAVCVILFALSFCSVSSMNIDGMLKDMGISQIEGMKITLSTVDYVTFMSYTTKNYKSEAEVDDKIIAEVEDAMTELQEHITVSTSGKIMIDRKGNALLRKIVLATLKMQAGSAQIDGTGEETNFILSGIVALLYILFASAMLVIAVINFLFGLLKNNNSLNKVATVMIPAYFIFALLTLYMCSGVGIKVAGAMIATLVFCALAISAIVADIVIFAKKGTRIALVPKFVSAIIVVIVIACAFAPAFTAKANIKPSGMSVSREYSYNLPLGVLGELVVGDNVKLEDLSVNLLIQTILTDESIQASALKGDYAMSVVAKVFIGCMQDYEAYKAISALSMGYWLMILVGIAGTISVGAIFAMANGQKTEKLDIAMKILMIIFIAVMFVCCVTGLVLANETLHDYYGISKGRASFGLGGGVITMLIFSILALVNDGVSKAILKKANQNDGAVDNTTDGSQVQVDKVAESVEEQIINNGENYAVNTEI